MHRKIQFITIQVLLFFLFSLPLIAAGVSPLVLDFDLKPGDASEFQLQLNPGETRQTMKFTLYHPIQKLDGGFSYQEGNLSKYPAIDWVSMENEQLLVIPGEENLIRGRVDVPYGAEGTHSVIVMVEQVEKADDRSKPLLSYKVRYAVRLNINVDRPGQRASAEIIDFNISADNEGRPILFTHFKNSSSVHYFASAEVTVRQGRHLIERVPIVSVAAERANREATRIYPGAEVIFKGPITEALFPGEYNLQLSLNYADGQRNIQRKTIDIGREFINTNMRRLSVTPELISEEIRAGAAITQALELKNNSDQPIQVKINKKDIEPNYKQSIFSTGDFQIRGDDLFNLDSRSSQRIVLIYRSSREVKSGGYYGQLDIDVLTADGEYIESKTIDLRMLIGDGYEYKTEVLDLAYQNQQDERFIDVNIRNLSSVHFIPTGKITLKDKNGELYKSRDLQLKEGLSLVLPGTSSSLVSSSLEIEPGNYTAEITIINQGVDLKTVELPLEIE